jgi:hypothetical protein
MRNNCGNLDRDYIVEDLATIVWDKRARRRWFIYIEKRPK